KVYKRPLISDKAEFQELKVAAANYDQDSATFKLGPLTTNLASNSNRLRFVSFELYLLPQKDEDLKLLEEQSAALYDFIYQNLDRFTPQEINTVSGKLIFESRLKNNINQFFGRSIIRAMYFSDFMVQ
ncbi:MAG: flagellar basal body-associated FliL family protein, partial [Bacteriovoracaceae bacterium]|nr:flagellar basal body-associated FliL family protein [Bacteriovoracaceae bacterium]